MTEKPDPAFDWGYALRELAIVFLGVLVALAVDNWNERRVERVREREYLARLADDVVRDSAFVATILPLLARKDSALQRIAPVVRRHTTVIPDTLAFLTDLSLGGAAGLAGVRIATRVTFADLESTGNLRLIRDASVRSAIVAHYTEAVAAESRIEGRRSQYALTVHRLQPAELRDRFSLEAVEPFGLQRIFSRVTTEEFEDLLNQEINYSIFARATLEQFAGATNEVLARLRAAARK